jgi:PncC family amidohydrolase
MFPTIEEQIQRHFISHHSTLALAESCTGGALAARLTRLPGCSQYFLGSIVAYSNELKIKLLGVDKQILREKGAVSEQVVKQMIDGLIHKTGSDYGIAVTGIAGPGGGSEVKPIGMIWGAIGQKGKEPYVWSFHLKGERVTIIQDSVDILLNQLCLLIKTEKRNIDNSKQQRINCIQEISPNDNSIFN